MQAPWVKNIFAGIGIEEESEQPSPQHKNSNAQLNKNTR